MSKFNAARAKSHLFKWTSWIAGVCSILGVSVYSLIHSPHIDETSAVAAPATAPATRPVSQNIDRAPLEGNGAKIEARNAMVEGDVTATSTGDVNGAGNDLGKGNAHGSNNVVVGGTLSGSENLLGTSNQKGDLTNQGSGITAGIVNGSVIINNNYGSSGSAAPLATSPAGSGAIDNQTQKPQTDRTPPPAPIGSAAYPTTPENFAGGRVRVISCRRDGDSLLVRIRIEADKSLAVAITGGNYTHVIPAGGTIIGKPSFDGPGANQKPFGLTPSSPLETTLIFKGFPRTALEVAELQIHINPKAMKWNSLPVE
jgi:hypothetical protein